jgi:hypothetical protein
MEMTESRTLAEYLNERQISPDAILVAAQYVANNLAGFPDEGEVSRKLSEVSRKLSSATAQPAALSTGLAKLARDRELLEQAALRLLALAWEDTERRDLVQDALTEAPGDLSVLRDLTYLAGVLVVGLWVYMSDGGERYEHTNIVRDTDGAFRSESTVTRDPFPVDFVALLREILTPHDGSAQAGAEVPQLSQDQVRAVQTALTNAGYTLKVDGVAGTQTRAAVERYQRDHHLTPTGTIDRATLDRLGVKV